MQSLSTIFSMITAISPAALYERLPEEIERASYDALFFRLGGE